jgi:hypothetical protein
MVTSPITRRASLLLAAAAVVVLTLPAADDASARAGGAGLQHVTLIGDSVATSLTGEPGATRRVNQGIDLDLEVAPCRRLEDQSCPPGPPTAIDLIKKLGPQIGPTVVIAVGYNDFEDRYAAEIEDVLTALAGMNVRHVLWLTLRAAHHPYVNMNDEIVAAATRHPELTVVDWNVYSRSHPEWFQPDGLHPLSGGAIAMATLVHQKLLDAGIAAPAPRVQTVTLPAGRRGKPYLARLVVASGTAPYSWSLAGRVPAGLHLRSNGVLAGTPRGIDVTGTFTFVVRVKDANGQTATRKLLLRLR